MPLIFSKVTLLLLVSVAGGALAQKPCGSVLAPMLEGTPEERFRNIAELHSKGLKSIPQLIASIDNREIAPVELQNVFWSSRRPLVSPVYCGVVAAYLIDLILGRVELSFQEVPGGERMFLGGRMNNYIFVSGCIVYKGTRNPIPLAALPEVKNVYKMWWKEKSGLPLSDLRKEWHEARPPLYGSPYWWD